MLLHRSSYVESISSELPGESESFAVGPSKWGSSNDAQRFFIILAQVVGQPEVVGRSPSAVLQVGVDQLICRKA